MISPSVHGPVGAGALVVVGAVEGLVLDAEVEGLVLNGVLEGVALDEGVGISDRELGGA